MRKPRNEKTLQDETKTTTRMFIQKCTDTRSYVVFKCNREKNTKRTRLSIVIQNKKQSNKKYHKERKKFKPASSILCRFTPLHNIYTPPPSHPNTHPVCDTAPAVLLFCPRCIPLYTPTPTPKNYGEAQINNML